MEHLQTNNVLDNRQHTIRPGFGTRTYFASLNDILAKALHSDEHVEMASLDLDKAYYRARTPDSLRQLLAWDISGNLAEFIRNLLTNRTFQVIIGNHRSKTTNEETGVPQGSVIAVALVLVEMNGVLEVMSSRDVGTLLWISCKTWSSNASQLPGRST
ncbi:uncharacterized protein LOC134289620 [Aedes albopictus]|uniref:Reverse transcriptase domain-containing protein n=1 Tax=Aedes albopictus TaxID=7160 RepID=A0ABM2A771_AEDAL